MRWTGKGGGGADWLAQTREFSILIAAIEFICPNFGLQALKQTLVPTISTSFQRMIL
jgi:hypothetical protein